jgi:hypothetical protein
MGSRLGDCSEIGNVNSLLHCGLVGGIKDRIEGDVLKNLMDSEFVGIENHG